MKGYTSVYDNIATERAEKAEASARRSSSSGQQAEQDDEDSNVGGAAAALKRLKVRRFTPRPRAASSRRHVCMHTCAHLHARNGTSSLYTPADDRCPG